MNVRIIKLGSLVGISALALGLLSANGCDEAAKQCGLECSETGVADGNASISGYIAIDSFFQSVVNFKGVANGVAADIRAELSGIQLAFGLSDAEVKAKGSLGAAVAAKLDADFKASIKVDAQPAKCEIDASVSLEAQAQCSAKAGCEVDKGKLAVQCEGTCTAEANVSASGEVSCEGEAKVACEVSGPQLTCSGTCEGSCTVDVAASGSCEGACKGECSGSTDAGGHCNGTCSGKCELSGMAAASCSGTCSGSCTAVPPSGKCEANANVKCQAKAEAMANATVECKGSCDAEFEPPKVDCEASASCEASAKADAKFQAKCTPPSIQIDVDYSASLSASAQAQADFAIGELKVRLPRLLAALEKAKLVVEAGKQLGTDGAAAIKGTVQGVADGDVGVVAAYRIATCVPDQLTASTGAITASGKGLSDQVTAAGTLTSTFAM